MEFNNLVKGILQSLNEAKEAPDGKHYTSRGSLKSGDADADGRGGPKFRSDPTYKNPNESEEGKPIKVETQMLNHRGGVTARSYSTFDTLEEFKKVLPRMKMIYQRILVKGKKIEGSKPEEDAEYRGRKVSLNKPTRGDVKKFKVYVKDPKSGNVKKVNFGHGGTSAKRKTMRIRKSNPKARKSFRARHKCDQKKSKLTAGYWSCKKW